MSSTERPTAPILGVDESKDLKAFYHNVAYKTNRVAINLEKMKILKDRLGECVRKEGVNYIDKCEQLTKRYEAAVRVCQWNSGTHSRPRNIGNILEKEKEIQAQLKGEGALAA
ncbi:hypothetical protein OEZ86_002284 [Tetradesmus obliquus]|uniref:NADH dehydrogenase [ubiquinone] 1 beta subcomplex subunit 10 n=1 Tax=Tetradesmus obliquus TaxID=3088 RepID=A0ABY8TQB4_TETOB|nr:hypothetical protein OEZ85_011428 [Tetradesmus obliquus]WIA31385.1 hypothetical protein OEZ86_002284 [Tetradesmus obliquus]